MTLYETCDRQSAILSLLADMDDMDEGEIPEDLAAELDAIDGTIEQKVEAICQIRAGLTYEGAAIDAEANRLKSRAASRHRQADALKRYLQECLERSGVKKVKTPLFTVWVQQSTPSIAWDGLAEDVPEQFRRVRVEVDRQAAMNVWKQTGEVPAGFTISQGSHVVIR